MIALLRNRLSSASIGLFLLSLYAPRPADASCAGMASIHPYLTRAAAVATDPVPSGHLRVSFVGHSTFEVESPQGVRVATDYNDYVRPTRLPHIVTMNRAHNTHFTHSVEEGVRYVLRGWDPDGGIARHNIQYKDVRVRNVPTNLQEFGGRWSNGNSMFVIEAAGLCVAHISHLHHVLSPEQVRELGLIDVAFAPIDGMWTMSHVELFEVLDAIKPRMIIPMHFGSFRGVEAFIARAKPSYEIREHESSSILISLRTLPREPEVLFLQGH